MKTLIVMALLALSVFGALSTAYAGSCGCKVCTCSDCQCGK